MTPRYPLAQIQALVNAGQVLFANQRAERNVLELDWTSAMLAAFVCGLKPGHHRGVRLGLSVFDGRGVIDADKYRARFNEATSKVTVDSRCCEYFVELAVKSLPSGATVLIVSFHLDGQP